MMRELLARQADLDPDKLYSGWGDYLHNDADSCEDAPESGYIYFNIYTNLHSGPADLCPECDWPTVVLVGRAYFSRRWADYESIEDYVEAADD